MRPTQAVMIEAVMHANMGMAYILRTSAGGVIGLKLIRRPRADEEVAYLMMLCGALKDGSSSERETLLDRLKSGQFQYEPANVAEGSPCRIIVGNPVRQGISKAETDLCAPTESSSAPEVTSGRSETVPQPKRSSNIAVHAIAIIGGIAAWKWGFNLTFWALLVVLAVIGLCGSGWLPVRELIRGFRQGVAEFKKAAKDIK